MTVSIPSPKPLIVIVGPTAVGKTDTAIQLAEQLDGEIISADSRLFYRGMDIGTAKPNREELTRVPHHLINVADPDEIWSLAIFQNAATVAIEEIRLHGKLPFLVGGTGQYVRAVTQGWTPPPVEPDPGLRELLDKQVKEFGPTWLHERLRVLDPQAADKIDPRNVRRTIRALEVVLTSGKPFSEQNNHTTFSNHFLQIGLIRPRKEIYQRVDERIELMFDQGLLEEVKGLLAKGYSPQLPTMSAIGYRECIQVLQGEMTVDEAKHDMRRATRVFVRRQANWFKLSDPEIRWFEAGQTSIAEIHQYIEGRLTSI